ncbi:MAG: S41 family peptidase [Ignavibacterium sp.]|nr:S41 family peptidase [Ignavibacterium sp.]MDX9712387.1 S41 family peptidase [Ignavibacteriaceae bacterium]
MKNIAFTSLIMIMFTTLAFCQDFKQTDCNCEQASKQLIQKIETEYPGFNDKTKDKLVYKNFKENLLEKTHRNKDIDCIDLLRSYIKFFKDGHITVYQIDDGQKVQNNKIADNRVSITEEEFQNKIQSTTDPFEGIWRSGSYKVGIIKSNTEYLGFIIEADTAYWKPNEIKFRLLENGKANYYLRDHSLSEEMYELVDGWILYFNFSRYIKEFPKPNLSEAEYNSKINEIQGCYFKKLTDKTAILGLSSFEHNYVDPINKILADNKQVIESCDNLIIDVRNNLGGVYEAYENIFPYILTNEVRGLGMEFLATETLIDEVKTWYDDEEGEKKAAEWIKMFRRKLGEFVNTDSTDVYINKIILAEHSPKQVVILANNRTASSGEAFVFEAKQSKKVKILGTPTYGALDYGSASFFSIGCKNYKLMMPTWRSMRLPDYPIDNIGIQPDIYLDKSVKDWILFTVNYLENK